MVEGYGIGSKVTKLQNFDVSRFVELRLTRFGTMRTTYSISSSSARGLAPAENSETMATISA
jgi:hypothetical protein